MSGHTPGPWKVENFHDGRHGLLGARISPVNGLSRYGVIAQVVNTSRDTEIPLDVASSNARLIAAAPEMLQMLRYCSEWLQGSEPHRARAVNEVIAKATGAQP